MQRLQVGLLSAKYRPQARLEHESLCAALHRVWQLWAKWCQFRSVTNTQNEAKKEGALAFQIDCATGLVSRGQGSAKWETLLTKGLRFPRAKQT